MSSPTSETIEITVNGEARETSAGATLTELLHALGRDPEQPGVAVAVEGEVVRREDWNYHTLTDDENIEIVAAQQGG